MITITKEFSFCYGHRLPGHKGKCKQQHGHNSILQVELSGPPGPDGMIEDFGDLKETVMKLILEDLDHQFINDLPIVDMSSVIDMRDEYNSRYWNTMITQPTAENILVWIVDTLEIRFGQKLNRVRLTETPTSWAEWKR